MNENMLDDPESAATLFEMVEPSLPRPTAVLREFTPLPGLPRWTLRTKAGAFRLKMAADVGTAAQLARGAGVLEGLRVVTSNAAPGDAAPSGGGDVPPGSPGSRGGPMHGTTAPRGRLRVPRLRRLELHLSDTELSVAIEERLGTGDARAAWPALSTTARCAVAQASAETLLALHALPLADVPVLRTAKGGWAEFRRATESSSYVSPGASPSPGSQAPATPSAGGEARTAEGPSAGSPRPPTEPGAKAHAEGAAGHAARPWREVVFGRIERRVAALRGDGVLDNGLLARVEDRLRRAASALPVDLERRPCHGGFGIESVAISRKGGKTEVVGLQDFELACAGDPWMDVAYWLASSGEPDGLAARRFFETYRDGTTVPDDLPARIDLYAGLTVLRAIAYLTPDFTDEGCTAVADVTESWVSTPPRPWI